MIRFTVNKTNIFLDGSTIYP